MQNAYEDVPELDGLNPFLAEDLPAGFFDAPASEGRHLVWLYRFDVLGESMRLIAQNANRSIPTVHHGIRKARGILADRLAEHVLQHQTKALMQLDYMTRDLLQAWRDSKEQPTTKTTSKKSKRQGSHDPDRNGAFQSTETETAESHGDPRYLSEARQVIAEKMKIIGGYAPKKTEHHGDPLTLNQTANLNIEGLSIEDLRTVQQATRLIQNKPQTQPSDDDAEGRADKPIGIYAEPHKQNTPDNAE